MNVRVRATNPSAEMVSEVIASDDLVRQAQKGEVGAFEQIYGANSQAVFALCRRMVRSDSEARDLVQDVFVHAWEKLTTFRGESSLATWLHRLAVNVVLQHLRASKRESLRLIEGDVDSYRSRSDAPRLEAAIDLDSALLNLPDGARAVFLLHDVEGYSHDEISAMTGIAPGTSRAQLWRARRILMKSLDI
jgi:RNA polymerase sigma-70 factor, ECF subfamily